MEWVIKLCDDDRYLESYVNWQATWGPMSRAKRYGSAEAARAEMKGWQRGIGKGVRVEADAARGTP